jgi:hypothetical protein
MSIFEGPSFFCPPLGPPTHHPFPLQSELLEILILD